MRTAGDVPALPASCARPVVRPLLGKNGWHRVQFELEDAYCGRPAGKLHRAILAPGARSVTENHRAGAIFTALYADGARDAAARWLRTQLDDGLQGSEQGGGYTNAYRSDVLAGLRWAVERDDQDFAALTREWLRRSFALDALHVVPGSFEVALPCSRAKLYNRDGRSLALALLAGEEDPHRVFTEKRWQYPAYDDVRWLADAILAGRVEVDPGIAAWALRRDRGALDGLLATLRPLRLRSPLRWVLLSTGAWYSYAPAGIEDAPTRPVDAVVVRADGTVAELVRGGGGTARGPVRREGQRLVAPSAKSIEGGGAITLPPGEEVLSVELGGAPRASRAAASP